MVDNDCFMIIGTMYFLMNDQSLSQLNVCISSEFINSAWKTMLTAEAWFWIFCRSRGNHPQTHVWWLKYATKQVRPLFLYQFFC